MTREEFLIAACKGQGRALAALRRGEIQPSIRDFRRLVIRWPGYDWQCESSRGWYTAEIIEASGFAEALENLLIRHLVRVKSETRHICHRAAVVTELAKRGFARARQAIYTCFDAVPELRLGEGIVEVDGFRGLEWILSQFADRLIPGETWQFDGWLDDLRDSAGETVLAEWLSTASVKWPVVGEFVRLDEERKRRRRTPREQKPDLKISFDELRREFFATYPRRRTLSRRWLVRADEAEQQEIWAALLLEDDPEWLHALGRALNRKPKFADVDRVIDRARSWHAVDNPFVWSLEGVVDSRLRQLGFDLIAAGWVADGISLFRANFQTGDQTILIGAAESLTDDFDRHGVGGDFLDIPKERVHPDILLWTYEHTPCAFCRESALRHLDETVGVPDAILQEALLDCDEDARTLAQKRLKPSQDD